MSDNEQDMEMLEVELPLLRETDLLKVVEQDRLLIL